MWNNEVGRLFAVNNVEDVPTPGVFTSNRDIRNHAYEIFMYAKENGHILYHQHDFTRRANWEIVYKNEMWRSVR